MRKTRNKAKENNTILPSKQIENFLDYMRERQEQYNINNSILQESDKEIQDILHKIELEKLSYHEYAKLSKDIKKVRQARRKAKDMVMILEPIVNYLEQNKSIVNSLSQLLGKVRKEEKRLENRFYLPKSEKYKSINKGVNKGVISDN